MLQTAKLNKSVKIERQAKSKIMAANSRISRVYVHANFEKEEQLQKTLRLLQNRDSTQIALLPPPWREKFHSLSLDSNILLYLDKRLVIPKDMIEKMLTVILDTRAEMPAERDSRCPEHIGKLLRRPTTAQKTLGQVRP